MVYLSIYTYLRIILEQSSKNGDRYIYSIIPTYTMNKIRLSPRETIEYLAEDINGRQIVMYENMVIRELMTVDQAIERFGNIVLRVVPEVA